MFASRRIVGRTVVLAAGVGIAAGSLRMSSADGKDNKSQKIVVVGGGTAGLGVAAMLRNDGMKDVVVIEPQSNHYYQPLWTLVGAGYKDNQDSVKKMSDVMPSGVQWVQKAVKTFEPEKNQVTLSDGSVVSYDYLVVAGGLQIDWKKIPGLVEGLEKPDSGVVSIYDYNFSDKTFRSFEKIKEHSHRMLFTMPVGLIKCAGAPQKIMWLLEDLLREQGLRDRTTVEFWVPGPSMFGIKRYADQLEVLRQKRGVEGHFRQELLSIDVEKKIATFKNLDANTISEEHYDLLHVCPPMSAPEFIKNSPLASKEGWMEVNKHTLQSTKYPNVFGIGDCTNTPNSKTAAAITAQAPVLVHNLTKAIDNQPLNGSYNGYASCPLIVKKHRVILAEFGYDGKIMESFDSETGKFPMNLIGQQGEYQQQFFYWLKEQFFPLAYWNLWVRGRWYGTNGPFKPDVTAESKPAAPPASAPAPSK